MNEKDFADLCKGDEGGVWIGRTSQGDLFVRREGAWEAHDFNALHKGYYPRCVFTALARAGGLFYLAGVDGEGRPHIFTSLLGGVWEERGLTAKHPLKGEVRATGKVLRILYDEVENQVFLLCGNGQLVTLPDCPKCLSILELREKDVADGRIADREIVVRFADESEQRISLEKAVQYRVAASFMRELLLRGGVVVDVRTAQEYLQDALPGSVNVPLEELDTWLAGQEKKREVVFVCRTGALADVAVRYARRQGFARAYSMGGTNLFAHVE